MTTPARARTAGTRTGSLGISDRHQHVCFALALWNGRDPILKERLFGLNTARAITARTSRSATSTSTPCRRHSYMKALYKYPQAAYPYARCSPRTAAAVGASPSTSCPTPASSPRAATGTCSSSTPRPRPRTCSSRSPSPIAAPRRRPSTSCPPCGSAIGGRGDPGAARPQLAGQIRAAGPRSSSMVPDESRRYSTASRTPSCSSRRTRPISPGSSARRTPRPG